MQILRNIVIFILKYFIGLEERWKEERQHVVIPI